jgi:hypothetical protein
MDTVQAECTYVTALYNIHTPDSRNHSALQNRIDLLCKLFLLDSKIIAFLDPEYTGLINESLYPNVKCIYRSLDTFLLWRKCHEKSLDLPTSRNTGKDTVEFLALMNTKIEFVKEALEYCTTPIIGWIDGSIYHIVQDEEKVKRSLEKQAYVKNQIKVPGPNRLSPHATPIDILANQIQWKFCGGIFQGKKETILKFYEKSLEVLGRWIERGRLTWEVNLWIEIANEEELFDWVYGDHNDSMLMLNE